MTMKKIFMLAFANIRKTKGQTVVLAALFLIASMVLNVGLIVLFSFGSFFDRTAEELNTSEAYFIIPEHLFNDEAERYLYENTTKFQKNHGILTIITLPWRDEMTFDLLMIADKDEPRELSRWKLVGDYLPETPDSIYMPYIAHIVGGYNLGDKVTFEIDGQTYNFTVTGFVEKIFHDSTYIGEVLFIPGQRFQELSESPYYRKILVYANGVDHYTRLEADLLEITGASPTGMGTDATKLLAATSLENMRTMRTNMPSSISFMMIMFTAVIAVVCLLVIRFRISNSIEEDMPKIGSLQSIGYTSRQITLSVVIQYGIIAIIACLAGVIPAYLLLPAIGDVFAVQSGLFWEAGFEPVLNLLAVGALTLIVIIAALVTARKIRKISPVQALRGGITTHSFKRNYVPFDKTRLPLTAALALKSILQSAKQSIMMFVILLAVSFTAVFAALLYYNAAVDLSQFKKVPGIELSNAIITFIPGQDAAALRDEVLEHSDVRFAQYLDSGRIPVDGFDVGVIIMDNYNYRVTDNIYEGFSPRFDNEIAISGSIAGLLGKNIGDEVLVGKNELPYLITGLTQGMETGTPRTVYLTLGGMRNLVPDFEQIALMVYLNRGVVAADFNAEMEEKFAGRTQAFANMDTGFEEGVQSFSSIIALVGLAILVVAGAVIILVLYFVISSAIIRRRRELGIQKAIGYTTSNLMNQISLGFSIPIILGAAAGCFLGAIALNPLMSVGSQSMGVMKASYIIDTTWVAASGICIVILAYLTSMLITWRIRKISAYALVTE